MRWIALLLAALLALPAVAKERAERFSAMTFNIRLDIASDGDNAWVHRRHAVTALVAYHAPDFVGMQEVLPGQKREVEADLPAYAWVGVARDDGHDKGEYSPLGFRRDRYALRASGTFWLSPTPDVPGKAWDAAYPRIATWARLESRRTRRQFLVVNTHFDHVGAVAKLESARQLVQWIDNFRREGDAVVLLGDFNSPTGSPPYTALIAGSTLRDTLPLSRTPHYGPRGTFTNFQITRLTDHPIDHIFVGDGITVLRHATLSDQTGGKLPSDHYPVFADLCIGKDC